MKHDQITIAAFVALHNPLARNEPMVYEVWEDGEITITKGAELYGQRNLHMISCGRPECSLPVASLPLPTFNGEHARILVSTSADAQRAQDIVFSGYAE